MLHIERLKADIDVLSKRTLEREHAQSSDLEITKQWLHNIPPAQTLRTSLIPLTGRDDWSCAVPINDMSLNLQIELPSDPFSGLSLVAVDGSQIYPDRHAPFLYYLIQVGGIVFRYNGESPIPYNHATLHFEDQELYDQTGQIISAARIGVRRALAEMDFLATLVSSEHQAEMPHPIIALTDGPLLWIMRNRGREEMNAQNRYFSALSRIRDAHGAPIGFVERPTGRFLIDLLWAAQLAPEDLEQKLGNNPLMHLDDATLLHAILPSTMRTGWLERISENNTMHDQAGHRIWFCYINVGLPKRPVIARVEAPVWVARQEGWIEIIHQVLVHQASVLHGNPYVLARAHEEALVTTKDKAILEEVIQRRLFEHGIVALPSEKARQKAYLSGR